MTPGSSYEVIDAVDGSKQERRLWGMLGLTNRFARGALVLGGCAFAVEAGKHS